MMLQLVAWQTHCASLVHRLQLCGRFSLKKLGERDTRRFSDVHLQNLLDKGYSDEGALQDATREGLQTPPALPPALIDKVLKAFGQPGEKYVYVDVCIHMCTLLHMFVFEEHVIADLMSMWASCY